MNLYLDTSALIKRYISEKGSQEVNAVLQQADILGATLVTYAEMTAAFAKIVRMGLQDRDNVHSKMTTFYRDWRNITRVPVTESLLWLAGDLAWEHGLRGYDAVQLASAMVWRDYFASPVTFATFDKKLWQAAGEAGLEPFPANLAPFLSSI